MTGYSPHHLRVRDADAVLEVLRAAEHALHLGASETERSLAYARVVEERRKWENRLNDLYASKNAKLQEAAKARKALMAKRRREKIERMADNYGKAGQ